MAYFIPDFVFDELSKQFEVGLNEGFDYGESKVKALEEIFEFSLFLSVEYSDFNSKFLDLEFFSV